MTMRIELTKPIIDGDNITKSFSVNHVIVYPDKTVDINYDKGVEALHLPVANLSKASTKALATFLASLATDVGVHYEKPVQASVEAPSEELK